MLISQQEKKKKKTKVPYNCTGLWLRAGGRLVFPCPWEVLDTHVGANGLFAEMRLVSITLGLSPDGREAPY